MRRVFPLRPSENCLLVSYDAEDLHGKESKPDDRLCGSNASTILDFTTRLRRQKEANCDVFPSGDENYPAPTAKRGAVGKTPSFHKPSRASAYPVFTGGPSLGHPSSRCALSLDENQERLNRLSSDKQQIPGSTSSRAYVSEGAFAKEVSSNEVAMRHERPCSTPRNRLSFDTSSPGNLRSSSVRFEQVPDSVARLLSSGAKLVKDCDAVSDGRAHHARALSQAASEKSDSKSSDNSSCFTKTTESSSSRSLASDSSYSKKSSSSGKPRNGNSPFRHLTARIVAEKIVKVLGTEKLCLQSCGLKSPHTSRLVKQDFNGATQKDCGLPCEATVPKTLPVELRFPTETSCRSNHTRETSGSIHFPEERSLSPKKCDYLVTVMRRANAEDSCKLSNASSLERDPDASFFQKLEARALAREELAAMLDRESNQWNYKLTPLEGHDQHSLGDVSNEISLQSSDALRFEISRIRREKRDLALEVAAEIRTRVSEQKTAADALRLMKLEMECRVSAIEKDKASVQGSLERELERREEDWGLKLSKIRTEERRLRDRVTEIAEDRIELQKVIASFKSKEASWKAQAKESKFSMQMLKQRADASEAEVLEMKKSFTDVSSKLKAIDGELDSLAQRNKFLEMENKELQKVGLRLRRVCNDQEMTIEGLLQELDEAVNSTSECRSDSRLRLQRELLRLAGIEQGLRNEMDALHAEIASFKQEKTVTQEGALMNLVNLSQESQGRMYGLQAQAVSLQDRNQQLSLNLRTALREKRDAETTLRMFQYSIEGMHHRKDCLTVLDRGEEGVNSPQSNELINASEEMWKKDLNEEANLLWKVLSGKLHLRNVELQHLDKEITALILSRDSLQMEVDELHGKLVMANQRVRELERQLVKKDEEIEVLQGDMQDHVKELDELRNELPCTRRQRDEMHQEAEDMSREAQRLTLELTELRKVVEKLDEELMLKEGQISILRVACGSGDF